MDGSVLPLVIATLMVVAGVAGAVLPGLPGVPLVYAGLLVAAWADDFQRVGWVVLVLLGMLTALSFVIDLLAVSLGLVTLAGASLPRRPHQHRPAQAAAPAPDRSKPRPFVPGAFGSRRKPVEDHK